MNAKIELIATAMFCAMMTAGCSYIESKMPANPPTGKEQICSELRRNIIFNTTSMSSTATSSPTQRAEMDRLYKKNDCDNLNKK